MTTWTPEVAPSTTWQPEGGSIVQRLTESGSLRITEQGDVRLIEFFEPPTWNIEPTPPPTPWT